MFGAVGRRDAVTGHSPNMSKPPVMSSSPATVCLDFEFVSRTNAFTGEYLAASTPKRFPPGYLETVSTRLRRIIAFTRTRKIVAHRNRKLQNFDRTRRHVRAKRTEREKAGPCTYVRTRAIKVYRVNDLAYKCVRA